MTRGSANNKALCSGANNCECSGVWRYVRRHVQCGGMHHLIQVVQLDVQVQAYRPHAEGALLLQMMVTWSCIKAWGKAIWC